MLFETDLIGQAAGLLNLAAFIPFTIGIFRSSQRPNRATWWIWALLNWIMLPEYIQSGAGDTAWAIRGLVVGSSILAVLVIPWGEGGWTKFDLSCLAGALLSVAVW